MSSITDDIFSRSRRRCVVKGRSSYLESESLVPTTEEIKLDDEHSNSDIPNEYEYSDTVDTEDIDEEPVTIDLSDFLNENALLSEPTAEHATESGLALSDCHSQFRVTSSLADPSPIPVEEVPSLKELTLDESITTTEDSPNFLQSSAAPSVSVSSSDVFTGSSNISTDVGEENIPIEESVLINKSSPLKGPVSKTPMGLSNAFQKFKGVPVMKDLNKNTVQTFGKYPIVKCEKLNMENFVKKNIIKVGNWPLSKVNNHSKSKLTAVKNSPIKKFKSINSRTPKLFNKPISFNKYVSKNASGSSVNIVRSILVDPFDSKPATVSTNTDNSASFTHSMFANSHSSVSESLSKHIAIGSEKLIKLVSQKMTPQQNSLIVTNRKFPIITSVNKMDGNSKTFKIISPKKFIPVNENKSMGVTPILPKPVETVVPPVLLKDTAYTVIEPYVEDPTSPVKLKPILTVPIDIIPTIEGIEKKERINATKEISKNVKVPSKFSKLNRSVFLNGAIKQTSVPIRQRNELSPKNKVVLNQNLEKSENILRNSKEINFEESILKTQTAVVATIKGASAIKSVFSKSPTKRQPKSKQIIHKDNQIQASHTADGSLFGCQSYNNSLNDILFGFGGSEDFTEESYSVNSTEAPAELCSSNISNSNLDSVDSQPDCSDKILHQNENKCEDKSEDEKHKKVSFFTNCKRQKDSESSHDSDTLSASEGGDDYDEPLPKVAQSTKKKRRKLTSSILRNLKRTQKPMVKYSKIQKRSDVETSRAPYHPPGRRISIKEENSSPIPALPDSIHELNSDKDKIMSPSSKSEASDKETSDTLSIKQKTVSKIDDLHSGMSLRNTGKETRTTLRSKRKIRTEQEISNINVKKLPDKHTSKLNQQRVVSGKDKHLRFIRSRFKPNVKTTQNAKIVTKSRKRLSRPSDIIQEIKTITSGNTMSGKGKKKNSKVFSAKENVLNSSENGIDNHDNDLVSKAIAKPSKRKVRTVRPKSKKKLKTLKVLFKRSKQKQNSNPLKMQFDEISLTLLDNVNETNSVLDNNGSINSTFRDGKGKTGSPGKEGNLSDSEVPSNEQKSEIPMKTTVLCDETQIICNKTSDEICPNNSEIPTNVENFKSSDNTIIDKCEVIQNTESGLSKVIDESVKVDLAEPMNTADSVEDNSSLSTLSSDIHTDLDSKANAGNKMVNAEGDDSSLGSSEIKTLQEQSVEIGSPAENKVTHKNKRKSCPKLKISKAKTKETVETTDVKNWYVSERKASTDSTQSEENVAKQNESVELNILGSPSDLCEISPVVETKEATDTEQSSNLLEVPTVSKATKANNIESCEMIQPESNSFTKAVNYPVTTDSSDFNLDSNVVASTELPINETLNTPALKTASDVNLTDSTPTAKSAGDANITDSTPTAKSAGDANITDSTPTAKSTVDVTISDEIITDNAVDTEEILKNADNSMPENNDSLVSSSLVSSTSNSITVEEQSIGYGKPASKDVENEHSMCSEQLPSPPIAIKEEPIDFEEDPPVQYSESDSMHIKVENEVSTHDHGTPDAVPTSTSTRKGRRSCAFSKTNVKSGVSNAESSGNVGEAVNAHENKAKKKGNSKITKFFKKQNATPEASQSTSMSDNKSVIISPTKGRKKKFCSDSVILPFSMGWMRELVHRSTEGKVGKKQSDIYYFSPEGTKLRSMIEIGNYLTRRNESKLSLVNFTFAKECVFREPFEIERSAKQKSVFSSPAATMKKETSTQSVKKRTLSCSSLKKTPISITSNKRASLPSKTSTPKLTIRNVNQGNKVKKKFMCSLDESNSITEKGKNGDGIGARPRRNTRNVSFGDDSITAKEAETSTEQHLISSVTNSETNHENSESIHSDPVQSSSVSKQNVTGNKKTKVLCTTQNRAKLKSVLPKNVESNLYQPCTPRCPVAKFQIPSIQCSMCLCLFHQNCVPRVAKGLGFACKSCISAKLELYETLRNPRSASAPESAEESNPDMPADMDISFLSPEINLRMRKSQAFRDGSLTTGTNYGRITSQATCVSEYPNSSSRPASIHPNSVPYAPQLLSHLLQPQPSLNPNARIRQIVPANNANFIRSQLVINRTSTNYLPRNFIRVGMRLPAVGNSITFPNSVVIRHLPEGKVVLRKGTLVTTPVSASPISALENLSQAIGPHENWSSISDHTPKHFSANENASSIHGKRVDMSCDSVVDKLESVPKMIRISDPSTSNDQGNALLECNAGQSNCDSDYVQSDMSSWSMNRFLISLECLNLVFKKLNACDLLRAGQVCKSWKHMALQSILDFCGIVHPDPEEPFKDLETCIVLLSGVQEVIFDQIPSSLFKAITCNMPQLRRLECHFVTNAFTEPEIWSDTCEIELSSLRCLGRLVKLKIGSGGGIILNRGPEYLMPYLPNLRHVSLTGFKFGSHINLESLSQQKELISLELGDCVGVEPGIYALLGCLPNLKSLRLENGGSMDDIKLSEALRQMRGLEVLELMNFKIPTNLVDVFKNFDQLIHLNVWPDFTTEGPLINRNLLDAMSNSHDLSYACWGVIADGESVPKILEIRSSTDEDKIEELTFEELFNKLVGIFPECRVEVKCVPRDCWREFCSTRR